MPNLKMPKMDALTKMLWPLVKPLVIARVTDILNEVEAHDVPVYREWAKAWVRAHLGLTKGVRNYVCDIIDHLTEEPTVEALKAQILNYLQGL